MTVLLECLLSICEGVPPKRSHSTSVGKPSTNDTLNALQSFSITTDALQASRVWQQRRVSSVTLSDLGLVSNRSTRSSDSRRIQGSALLLARAGRHRIECQPTSNLSSQSAGLTFATLMISTGTAPPGSFYHDRAEFV